MKNLLFSLFKSFIKIVKRSPLQNIPGLLFFLYAYVYKKVRPEGTVLVTTSHGHKMYLNTEDKRGVVPFLLTEGIYEKCETELFQSLIKPGMVVVDVGANIGYYTLIAAQLVGSRGKVYAFEPEPHNYELLVRNIELNGYSNVITVQKAVSNKLGLVKLFTDQANLGCHSFAEDNISAKAGFVEVETTTLDEFFNGVKIDFIKMDIQGAEGLAIEGGEKILKSNNLKITMEFWPQGFENMGTNPLELLHRLQSWEFTMDLIDITKQRLTPIEPVKVIEQCKKRYIDLLLTKING